MAEQTASICSIGGADDVNPHLGGAGCVSPQQSLDRWRLLADRSCVTAQSLRPGGKAMIWKLGFWNEPVKLVHSGPDVPGAKMQQSAIVDDTFGLNM
ncbi:hypothetical protein NDS46_25685 [Paenibacillus thiaminolyticus]|uniref:hypothetical protein n=1 Tax=Paenibacillus thiaminolyticus TaxID=49283 RepID=UPI00232BAC06|nr:hypothetical protein [Paenibacillus thiaminolyticus]WCF07655.1 hypothetical protein NDS46_25685 [Paenibacillus thiaminolyticus]